jgi:hypothetical protein
MLATVRAERVGRRVPVLGPAHNDADLAAIAWACEMTALEAAADAMSDRHIEWADFDKMLDDMRPALGRVAAFFGFPEDARQLQRIAQGPLMTRYSKDLGYEYNAGLRRDLIAEATTFDRQNIDAALAMLRRAAEKSPLLARAIARAES